METITQILHLTGMEEVEEADSQITEADLLGPVCETSAEDVLVIWTV